MELTEQTNEGIDMLLIKGDIDLHHSPQLRTLLRGKISSKCPALLVNFSEVNYIDSSGIATLVEYFQGCRNFSGKMALAALNPRVKSVFELVRLNEVFSIFITPEEAHTHLKS
jgi:anti-sigma B factor antagonist